MSVAMEAVLGVVKFTAVVFAVCIAPGIAGKAVMKKR